MKYYRLIGVAAASVLSLSAFAVLTSTKDVKLNRDFQIQTVSGDASYLNGVGLEGVIKTEKDSFEKVIVSNDSVDFESTKYDMYRNVGEDVLENRDVYRGIYFPKTLQTDDYLIVAALTNGFPYTTDIPTINLNIKDNKTGHVSKFKPVLDVTRTDYVYNEVLHENAGRYYYAVLIRGMNTNSDRILLYTINPKTGEFKKDYELKMGDIWGLNMVGDKLVTTSYSEKEGEQLVLLDLNSQEVKEVKTPGQGLFEYRDPLYVSNEQLFVLNNDKMYPFDFETLTFLKGVNVEPTTLNDDNNVWLSDFLVKDQTIYTLYGVAGLNILPHQLLVASDIKTGEVVFEGKMVERVDQGVLDSFKLVEVN